MTINIEHTLAQWQPPEASVAWQERIMAIPTTTPLENPTTPHRSSWHYYSVLAASLILVFALNIGLFHQPPAPTTLPTSPTLSTVDLLADIEFDDADLFAFAHDLADDYL